MCEWLNCYCHVIILTNGMASFIEVMNDLPIWQPSKTTLIGTSTSITQKYTLLYTY